MAQSAFAAALRVRRNAGYRLEEAICVYDLAERLGIEVRFADIPSMEGMLYCNTEPIIIVSSHRPSGRRAFTCAHELGHFHSGDGTTIDDLVGKSDKAGPDPKEFVADCFAGALLMPKMAVERAFAVRSWSNWKLSPRSNLHDLGLLWSRLFHVGKSPVEEPTAHSRFPRRRSAGGGPQESSSPSSRLGLGRCSPVSGPTLEWSGN